MGYSGPRSALILLSMMAAAPPALAQDTGDAPPPAATEVEDGANKDIYLPADFARFAPRTVLDMLRQVPGFTIVARDQGRGLGQANDNVLVNGERLTGKSESLFDQLARITASRVERIEIVDGAAFGIPGLSGQVANVIVGAGALSGRFEYRIIGRPRFAETSYYGGEISVSGSTPRLEWTAALTNNPGRGGAGEGRGATIVDATGALLEHREVLIQFVGEYPRLATTLKWDGPGTTVANFNASYSRTYARSNNDELRDLVAGVDLFRDFDSRERGYGYEFGGDIDFALGTGRLKLIGLERFNHNSFDNVSRLIPADGSLITGTRFARLTDSGERIGRAEYRWDMLGGSWQFDAEAAFNRFDQVGQLFALGTDNRFGEIAFPGGTGGVTEGGIL